MSDAHDYSKSLIGPAGEYHVMAELLRRGYIAALAPKGVPNVDIIVSDTEGSKLCSIQVKTRRDIGSDGGWHMSEKHERILSVRLFYCFVDFGKHPDSLPAVYILPSCIVAKALFRAHRSWLATPGKNGQQHNDTLKNGKPNKMRRLLPDYATDFGATDNPYPSGWLDQYRNAWHLLDVPLEGHVSP